VSPFIAISFLFLLVMRRIALAVPPFFFRVETTFGVKHNCACIDERFVMVSLKNHVKVQLEPIETIYSSYNFLIPTNHLLIAGMF